MRTKTMLLSALIGTIGAVSAMAQTNVYSLNAVGYINITAYPGFNMISCPLIASPDNTLNTLLPDTNGAYKKWQVWTFNPTANPQYVEDVGVAAGWLNGGTETISPGAAVWLFNPSNVSYTVTFVGTVPTGPSSVTLYPDSFNMVSCTSLLLAISSPTASRPSPTLLRKIRRGFTVVPQPPTLNTLRLVQI